jgi:hypothetical protein
MTHSSARSLARTGRVRAEAEVKRRPRTAPREVSKPRAAEPCGAKARAHPVP